MNKIKIFGSLRSRASRCVWAAEEAGVAYELVAVDTGKGEQKAADYLKINPNAHVPAMQDGDLTMFESLAINLYIAKKSAGPLAPKDLREDALMTMWSMWAITEVERHAIEYLLHTAIFPPEKRDAAAPQKALEALEKPFAILDATLAAGGGCLVGGRFTIADLNVCAVAMWLRSAPKEFHAKFPHIGAWIMKARARPARQKIDAGN
ncbi:MAG: glutathione S-transferase family protein [Hyphomicrobiales bacterium]|nr:glutathione S-transferase family protein [Hyphomicrobiales bacterium]